MEVRAECLILTVELDRMLRDFTPQAVAVAVVLPTTLGPVIWAELEVSRAEAAGEAALAAVPVELVEWVEPVE